MSRIQPVPRTPEDARIAGRAEGALADLNRAGVLDAADIHVARALAELVGERRDGPILATALVVRAVRHGSVCLDLADLAELREQTAELAWPDAARWRDELADSPLVAQGALCREGELFYLDRYWREEGQVADDLRRRVARPPRPRPAGLDAHLARLFPGEGYDEQRAAAEAAVGRGITILTGGPGTGKTSTLARLLAALEAGRDPARIALAAPTGKAAARMAQALTAETAHESFTESERDRIGSLEAMTLHRLLGTRRDNATRFRHHRGNRLPHDVVVVDETSMVPLTMMARLLEAVRPDAQLILIGDPDQLASVEAGAVLEDVVEGFASLPDSPVVRLRTSHRFGRRIGALADAVRDGEAERAWERLTAPEEAAPGEGGGDVVRLIDPDDLPAIRDAVAPAAIALCEAAEAGDRDLVLRRLLAHRLLCGPRRGPMGVAAWNTQVELWLKEHADTDWLPERYPGQPLLVDANDYGLRLWNGDAGAVIARPGSGDAARLAAVFDSGGPSGRLLQLNRLGDVSLAHAMTIHRSQGSQFDAVTVILPEPGSPLLTRELLYTAITRARREVRVVTTRESFLEAVGRRARRATGLATRVTA